MRDTNSKLNFLNLNRFSRYSIMKSKVENIELDQKIHMIHEFDVEFDAEFEYAINLNIKWIIFELSIFTFLHFKNEYPFSQI